MLQACCRHPAAGESAQGPAHYHKHHQIEVAILTMPMCIRRVRFAKTLYRKLVTNVPKNETSRQFHFWEYINRILLAVHPRRGIRYRHIATRKWVGGDRTGCKSFAGGWRPFECCCSKINTLKCCVLDSCMIKRTKLHISHNIPILRSKHPLQDRRIT